MAKIGDTVRGEYHGVAFEGLVTGFDGSGYMYIRTDIEVFGLKREGVCFGPGEFNGTVIKAGNVTEEQIGHRPARFPRDSTLDLADLLEALIKGHY